MSYTNEGRQLAEILINTDCYVKPKNGVLLPNGKKVPVYLSCRRLLSNSSSRVAVEKMLIKHAKNIKNDFNIVTGIATAGITWSHSVANELHKPMLYVRGKSKDYGIGGLVEGGVDKIEKSCNAIIIDDVFYSGNSINKAIVALNQNNIQVTDAICIALLNSKIKGSLKKRNINIVSLCDYNDLLYVSKSMGFLSDKEVEVMKEFYGKSDLIDAI